MFFICPIISVDIHYKHCQISIVYDMPVITEGAKDSPTVCDVAVQAYVGSFDLTIAAILLIEIIFRVVTVVLYCFI